MTAREQLLQELERTPDSLIQEILDFCLFLQQRQPEKLPQPLSPSQILDAIANLPLEGKTDPFSGQTENPSLAPGHPIIQNPKSQI